jgi:twitching motility protein PilT
MKKIDDLLRIAVERKASDLHLTVGLPPVLRINGVLEKMDLDPLANADTFALTEEMMDARRRETFRMKGEVDFSHTIPNLCSFRVNVYKQSGSVAAVVRVIPAVIPTFEQLHLPDVLRKFACEPRGLVLVTGPTGSGKSTTLAAMINYINRNFRSHIITLEDPIEYRHPHINCIINQREVETDTLSFSNGLRAALREDPDVILVGEMRDAETIGTAITAAETGHLVLATLHTSDAAQTVNRIIDVFPEHQQAQIRVQLAGNLMGIVAQQLMPTIDGNSRVGAYEILVATPALRNLIREGKTHQIQSYIQTGSQYGMISMDMALGKLVQQRIVDREVAKARCVDQQLFEKYAMGMSL